GMVLIVATQAERRAIIQAYSQATSELGINAEANREIVAHVPFKTEHIRRRSEVGIADSDLARAREIVGVFEPSTRVQKRPACRNHIFCAQADDTGQHVKPLLAKGKVIGRRPRFREGVEACKGRLY